jgi:soluble lytic murein transglycosylase
MPLPRVSALVLALMVFCGAAAARPAHKPAHAAPLTAAAAAIQAADQNRWPEAEEIAARSGDPVLQKLIDWLDMERPGTDASFQRIAYFIKANPDWPGLGALRKRAEDLLPSNLPQAEIIAWFKASPPQNPDNVPAYYNALMESNQVAEAQRMVRDFFVSGNFTTDQLRAYVQEFSQILQRADAAARADRLIWDGAYLDARAMLSMLDRDDQAADDARIVLLTGAPGAEAAVAELPADRQHDPDVLYARVKYAMGELNDDSAARLLEAEPAQPPHVAEWSKQRLTLARRMIESHDFKTAYALAAGDHATEPSQIAETQFLAGWISLRFLNDAGRAATHFKYMYDHVTSPVSKARAAYWMARAASASDDTLDAPAAQWMTLAAEYPTAFYGQIALEKLGRPLILPPEPRASASEAAAFEHNDLVRAARLLHQAHDAVRVTAFLDKLGEIEKTPVEQAEIVRLARDLDSVPLSVQIAKRAASGNIAILSSGYPVLPHLNVQAPEPALVHGIIRQESLFNTDVVSPAGAIGLMQLMPATASIEARKIGQRGGVPPAALRNPSENVMLGAHYLQDMIDNWNGSYILAIASYNAGPGHVKTWLGDNGDPRAEADPVDWIELIPISETRNYVQRVLENLQVYRARLSGGPVQVRLIEDMKR